MSLSASGIYRNQLAVLYLVHCECWWLRMAAREKRDAGNEADARAFEAEADEFEQMMEAA